MLKRLREDIDAVLERDPAARSRLEILLCYPGVHALLFHRAAHWLWRRDLTTLARWVSHLSRWLTGIEIHPGAIVGRRVFLDHGMGIVIGETAEVGDDCTIYQGVTLGGTSLAQTKRHPTLERGVIVGAGAKVLGGFTVREGARIGSNAVVVKEVPAGATAIGIPARVVGGDKVGAALDEDRSGRAARGTSAGAGSAQSASTRATSAGGPCDELGADERRDARTGERADERENEEAVADRREAQANRMGFSAYGLTANADDPLVVALHRLIDHTAEQDRRIEALQKALCKLGGEVEQGVEPFDAKALNRMVD